MKNCILLLTLSHLICVNGEDPFQRIFVGSNCLNCTAMTGCDGSQLKDYETTHKGADTNEPETEIYLFTRRNSRSPECLHRCGGRLPSNTNFVPNEMLHVIFTTFTDGVCTYAYTREIKDELLKRCDCNVMIIDWSWGSSLDLTSAMINILVVADQTVFVLNNIMDQTDIKPSKFYFIGWSLAAQLAGLTARQIKGVYRITALDAAGSAYVLEGPEGRLTRGDATIVDAIHTNGGDCVLGYFGYGDPFGDADFYPNGGKQQLNCQPIIPSQAVLKGDFKFAAVTSLPMICSHSMSIMYYKASINPDGCQMIGIECPNYEELGHCSCGVDGSGCAIMGYDFPSSQNKDGKNHTYYLKTEYLCPYCDKKEYELYRDTFRGQEQPHVSEEDNYGQYSDDSSRQGKLGNNGRNRKRRSPCCCA